MKRRIQETQNNWLLPCFFLVDCVVAVAVILFWYFLYYEDIFKINDMLVLCSDNSYNYTKQSSSLSETALYLVSFVVPSILILLFELIMAQYNSSTDGLPKEKTVITFDFRVKPTIRRIIRYEGLFIIGAFCTLIFSGIGRVIVGRPAPHFFTDCPELRNNCRENYVQYADGMCQNEITEHTRSSFPSYFASMSSYAALFAGIYLSKMMTITATRTLRPVFFITIMLLPFMVSLNRVSTHQEHWTDIIAGSLIGIFIALYMSLIVLNGFEGSLQKSNRPNIEQPKKEDKKGGGGIMQTLTREASRVSSRHASRREKGNDFMSRLHEVKYNTAHRSYYDNNIDDYRRQEEFVYNHQPPLPSFAEDGLPANEQAAIAAFKTEARDTDLGDGHLADDDQPMFLYHH
ncbi:phospholipid phosphatase-related protein type 1-like [Antedon mediterranea]|uniref:phospholipid phosphatase-related protein type 1-like n=1 Tax=Antedon mediterranea TaxID=105859 RepID=UPI003AF77FFF